MSASSSPRGNAAKKPRSKTAPGRTMTGFRCDVDQLKRITDRAGSYGMTRTDFIIAAALGELPADKDQAVNRFEAIERRLDRLEGSSGDG